MARWWGAKVRSKGLIPALPPYSSGMEIMEGLLKEKLSLRIWLLLQTDDEFYLVISPSHYVLHEKHAHAYQVSA